jgi:hypothetical protein
MLEVKCIKVKFFMGRMLLDFPYLEVAIATCASLILSNFILNQTFICLLLCTLLLPSSLILMLYDMSQPGCLSSFCMYWEHFALLL